MKVRMVEYQILAVFIFILQIFVCLSNLSRAEKFRFWVHGPLRTKPKRKAIRARLGPNASFTSPAEQSGGRPMTRSRAHAQRSNVAPDDGPPIRRFVFARAPCVRETGAPAVGTTPAAVAFFLPHLSRKARVIFLASSLLSLSLRLDSTLTVSPIPRSLLSRKRNAFSEGKRTRRPRNLIASSCFVLF